MNACGEEPVLTLHDQTFSMGIHTILLMLYSFLLAKHKLRMCFLLQLATATRRWLKLGQHRCLSCAPTQGSLMIGLWHMQSVCVPPFQRSSAAASSPILGNLKIVGRILPPNFYTSLLENFFSQFWGTNLVKFPLLNTDLRPTTWLCRLHKQWLDTHKSFAWKGMCYVLISYSGIVPTFSSAV